MTDSDYDSDYDSDSDSDSDYDSDSDSDYDSDDDSDDVYYRIHNIDNITDAIDTIFRIIDYSYFNSVSWLNYLDGYDIDPNKVNEILDYILNSIYNTKFIDINDNYYYKNNKPDNFLNVSVKQLNITIIENLLEYNIDVNILNSDGTTPLDTLYKYINTNYYNCLNFQEIEDILVENGAIAREKIIIKLQRILRKNMKIKKVKRNLAYSKSYLDKTLNRKPKILSELAPDLLTEIRKYIYNNI